MLFFLGYLWALPLTLSGLLVAVLGGARLVRHGPDGAFLFVAGDKGLARAFFKRTHTIAFCWGGAIVADGPERLEPGRVLRHELRHFAQARVLGPLMPVAYALCSLWALAHGGHAYRDNALEADARAAE